jgi:inner membrane protease subunit 1
VPQGHCWIVGDNLVASRDSRYFGPVPLALIRGKVIATVRPWSEIKWITNPLRNADRPIET